MTRPFTRETDLLRPVVKFHVQHGWQVKAEAHTDGERGRPDLYAEKPLRNQPPLTRIVEGKLGLCLRLLAQAWRWEGHAHQVCIAVSEQRMESLDWDFTRVVCDKLGIGIIEVQTSRHVRELLPPRTRELGYRTAFAVLDASHREAGSSGGQASPQRAAQYAEVAAYLREHDHGKGVPLHTVARDVGVNPGLLKSAVQHGTVAGIIARNPGGLWRLYVEQEEAA